MHSYSSSVSTIDSQQQQSLLASVQQQPNYASTQQTYTTEQSCHQQDSASSIKRKNRNSSSTYSSVSTQGTQVADCHSKQQQQQQQQQQNLSLFTHEYWQATFNKYSTSVYLENKGSVARDHLANERTYLAWLRTSLALVSVGIGITQLFRLERSIAPHPGDRSVLIDGQMIGLLFIFISMLFLAFAFIRYFHIQVALTHGYFPATRSIVTIATLAIFVTMILMLLTTIVSR